MKMDKSSKKSTKVDTAAAVSQPVKSDGKGKRGSEEVIDKLSAKKLKKNDGTVQAIEKLKSETTTQKKNIKKKESSLSDDESSESEEEEKDKKTTAVNKPSAAANKKDDSSSEYEDDSSEDSSEADDKATVAAKKDDSSDSSSKFDSEDDTTPAKKPASANGTNFKQSTQVSKKGSSTEESSEYEDSSEEEDVEMVGAVFPKTVKKQAGETTKKARQTPGTPQTQSGGSKTLFVGNLSYSVEQADVKDFFKEAGEVTDVRFSSDKKGNFKGYGHVDFATEEAAQKALGLNGKELMRRQLKLDLARERAAYTPGTERIPFQKGASTQGSSLFVGGIDRSSGEDESTQVSKKGSSTEESSEYEDNSEEEDVEMVGAVFPKTVKKQAGETTKKAPQTPGTSQTQSGGSKTLFVGNLPYSVEQADVKDFFKEAGEVTDVRFSSDKKGNFKGYGHVDFATEEAAQKALGLNGKELMRRQLKLDLARERAAYTPGTERIPFQKGASTQGSSLFVGGIDRSSGEDESTQVSKKGSSTEESSEYEDNSEEEDVEMVGAVFPKTVKKQAGETTKKAPQTPGTSQTQSGGSKTLFVGNLPYSVEQADVKDFFKEAGEVTDVRFSSDKKGNFKGYGHVDFATEEAAQKALGLNRKELMGRQLKLDLARERAAYTPGTERIPFQKGASTQGSSLFVGGIDRSSGEDESTQVSKKGSSTEESSEYEDSSEEEDVEMVGAVFPKTVKKQAGETAKKASQTPGTPQTQSGGSKTLFVGNLPYSIEQADVKNFFKEAGEVTDVRFSSDREGNFKGYGHVEFATEEVAQKALGLNRKELMGRQLILDLARERAAYTRGTERVPFQKGASTQGSSLFVGVIDRSSGEYEPQTFGTSQTQSGGSKILFVGNLPYSVEQADVKNFFKEAGDVTDVRFSSDREGNFKGYGHVEFATEEAAQKALGLNRKLLMGRQLKLDLARERATYTPDTERIPFQKGASTQGSSLFVGGIDRSSGEDEPQTPGTSQTQSGGSKTLFVGNLPYSVEQADVKNFFKEAGVVTDVRFSSDKEGNFKGYGHVEFATEEAAQRALGLNRKELMGRQLKLDLARERAAYTPGTERTPFQKGASTQGSTLFVYGIDRSSGEDEVRSVLEKHFASCGEFTRVSIPPNRKTGELRGIAYIDFTDREGLNKALELGGLEFGGYTLNVDEAKPLDNSGPGGRGPGGRGPGRFQGGGRSGGGRFDRSGGGHIGGGRFDRSGGDQINASSLVVYLLSLGRPPSMING